MHLDDFELIEAGCLFLLTLNLSESFKGSLLESCPVSLVLLIVYVLIL